MACSTRLSLGLALALCLAALLLVVAAGTPVGAQTTTRYVAPSGVDTGDCADPNQPCRTVQFAVDVSAGDDVIKIATGIYTDVHGLPPAPGDPHPPPDGIVHQVVYLDRTLTLQGGYQAPGFESPDPASNPTILDAGGQGRVFYVAGEIQPVLEGLGMTGGSVGGPESGASYGGGLYVLAATLAISDCIIEGNEAMPLHEDDSGNRVAVTGGQGGALYAYGAEVSILRSTVEGNRACYGGGGFLDGGKLSLVDSDLLGNTAGDWELPFYHAGDGGGLYLTGAEASLVGSAVTGNWAWGTGGGLHLVESQATLAHVTIEGNRADGESIGYVQGAGGGLGATSSHVTLSASTVSDNAAGWYGGGLYFTASVAILDAIDVTGNRVHGGRYGLWGGGAGLYLEESEAALSRVVVQGNDSLFPPRGPVCLSSSKLRVENTLIADNSTDWFRNEVAGAVDLIGSTATLFHVTLAHNPGWDGVHVAESSAVTLTNTILVSHTLGIGVAAGSTARLEATVWGAGAWANGVDWDNAGTLVTGTINLWGYPAFAGPAAGDYHIGPGSVAIDHGIPVAIGQDIDGEPRPDGCAYDIGADELLTGKGCTRTYLPAAWKSAP